MFEGNFGSKFFTFELDDWVPIGLIVLSITLSRLLPPSFMLPINSRLRTVNLSSRTYLKFFTFELDDWVFTETTAREKLLKHFETKNLKGFGVEHLKNGIIASGAILQYLTMTQHTQIGHITSLARIEESHFQLNHFTR